MPAFTLIDSTKAWTPNAFVGMTLRIIAGTGVGQRRIIASNTATTITVTSMWGTLPDATSEYDILSSYGSPISETILYTGKAVGALTGVTRGYEPEFSARSWSGGTVISRVLAAQDIRALQNRVVEAEDDIDALETLATAHDGRLVSLEDDRETLVQWFRVNRVWGAV
jgi:hypothetical protein